MLTLTVLTGMTQPAFSRRSVTRCQKSSPQMRSALKRREGPMLSLTATSNWGKSSSDTKLPYSDDGPRKLDSRDSKSCSKRGRACQPPTVPTLTLSAEKPRNSAAQVKPNIATLLCGLTSTKKICRRRSHSCCSSTREGGIARPLLRLLIGKPCTWELSLRPSLPFF
ncbi:hypothetical protein FOPG_18602 [Fusarium oxysporum f. sp. conglutinans race 2 54008]|uniref:Uncharacterized protein n=1 Tax=Fusarium oxysporum f. sp. conglutinans race 2 54008 TaxID=1089457 RepID=X0GND9_FUSOX|nr:hypothetical protein FOPG_18602 [Fusarium oxysporum f. sp. conglutinans race 2 54008]